MNKFIFTLLLGPITILASCKKDQKETINPDIDYRTINQKVKASDVDPLVLDVNQDGKTDFTFFAVYHVNNGAVHLNIGTNPIGDNSAKMGFPDDDKFQNMGSLVSVPAETLIDSSLKKEQLWSSDFAYLTIRTETQNNKTYIGAWSDGIPKIMALQLNAMGNRYFGWARLIFNRETEELILLDCAWNKHANEGIKAGSTK